MTCTITYPYSAVVQSVVPTPPTCILNVYDFGKLTFTRQLPLGGVGQYDALVWFQQLGYSRNRSYELVITDPVEIAIMGARIEFKPENRQK